MNIVLNEIETWRPALKRGLCQGFKVVSSVFEFNYNIKEFVNIYIYIYIPIHMHTHIHTHLHTYIHTYLEVYAIEVYIRTCMHTYICRKKKEKRESERA